jgi:hypothetical protein
VSDATPRVLAGEDVANIPRAAACSDHAFDDALICRCGVSWWTHQRLFNACPLNARGRNRGEGASPPPTRRLHA